MSVDDDETTLVTGPTGKKAKTAIISKTPSPKKVVAPVLGKTVASPPKTTTVPSPKKSTFRDFMIRKSTGPIAPGSKEIPQGAPNCLAGLTFVFTGELESLAREDAQDLVKRYGGKVTTAPSGKTSYVVIGTDAGPSKLQKIASLGISTLSEDGLLDLIRNSAPQGEKPFSDEQIMKNTFVPHASPAKLPKVTVVYPKNPEHELWTDRYAPQSAADLIGNHSNYEKIVQWLQNWYFHKL